MYRNILLFTTLICVSYIGPVIAMDGPEMAPTAPGHQIAPADLDSLAKQFIKDLIEMNHGKMRRSDIQEKFLQEIRSGKLDLSFLGNQLIVLPDSIGGLVNLTHLTLANTPLTTLPDSIGNLVNLNYLNLASNKLIALPDSIGGLVRLIRLNLSGNQITTLPNSIGGLVKLIQLDIANNQITTLPDSIGGLISLRRLNLYKNQLTALPNSIGGLQDWNFLFIEGNPLMGFNGKGKWNKGDIQKYVQYLEGIKSGAFAKLVFTEEGVQGSEFERLPKELRDEIFGNMLEKSAEEDLRK